MADAFVGEIRPVAFNFAPTGWALCNGQLLPISQNTALFSLLGTTYGGDGRSTFALPNLQGRIPVHPGQGVGLSERFLGEELGVEAVTLLESEIPAHRHSLSASATTTDPIAGTLPADGSFFAPAATSAVQAHENMPPFLVINYVIALQGIFPPRS